MKRNFLFASAAVLALTLPVHAHEGDGDNVSYASDHAPIGVMADHRHKTGEVMLSYRFMTMDMSGSRDGTSSLSPEAIATSVANPFAGAPGMPPTLRVVPTDMTMNMHMVGGMYGLSDRITLMAMGSYQTRSMDHLTFQGGAGPTVLGDFTTETEGIGDISVGTIIGLDKGDNPHRQVNLGLAVSLPTGSIDETDQILTPMGMTPSPRLPYPMQLGSGTFDLKPSLTARSRTGKWSYGAQAAAVIRLDDNDEGYSLGDIGEVTTWVAYEPQPWISFSGRVKARTLGQIDGNDPAIRAPVQTADPANQGGETVTAYAGVNLAGSQGWAKGQRVAAEIGLPLYRDLNGPQLETDLTFTLGWQKAF